MSTTKGFRRALRDLRRKMDRHYRETAEYAVERTLSLTPVESGRLAASWRAARNREPDSRYDPLADASDVPASHRRNLRVARSLRVGDSFTLASVTPYSMKAEYGDEHRAPAAMVRLTAAELRASQSR